jgi:hypothetical protein
VSCGGKGKLTITDDDDVIERTNLSRQQFLFRDWNIEPSLQSTPTSVLMLFRTGHVQILRTCSMTHSGRALMLPLMRLTMLLLGCTKYMDMRSLLESRTLGAKCNTENYGASSDPPEKQAPMCAVHSFPHNIDHCLTWARSEFEGLPPRENTK